MKEFRIFDNENPLAKTCHFGENVSIHKGDDFVVYRVTRIDEEGVWGIITKKERRALSITDIELKEKNE